MQLLCAEARRTTAEGIWWPVDRIGEAGLPTLFAKLAARGAEWRRGGMTAPGFTGAGLDRADHLRLDEARAGRAGRAAPRRGCSASAGLDPVLDEEGRLRLGARSTRREAELIFLGLDGDAPLVRAAGRGSSRGPAGLVASSACSTVMAPRDAAIWGAARSLNRMAQPPPFLRHVRRRDGRVPRRLGPALHRLRRRAFPARRSGRDHARRAWRPGAARPAAAISGRPLFGARRLRRARRIDRGGGGARARRGSRRSRSSDVRYVASQPWPFPGSLMIACIAEAASDELTLDTQRARGRDLGRPGGGEGGAGRRARRAVPCAAALRHRPHLAEALGGRLILRIRRTFAPAAGRSFFNAMTNDATMPNGCIGRAVLGGNIRLASPRPRHRRLVALTQ